MVEKSCWGTSKNDAKHIGNDYPAYVKIRNIGTHLGAFCMALSFDSTFVPDLFLEPLGGTPL